jgi:hypothetical protein
MISWKFEYVNFDWILPQGLSDYMVLGCIFELKLTTNTLFYVPMFSTKRNVILEEY